MIRRQLLLFVLVAVLAMVLGFWSLSPKVAVLAFEKTGYLLVFLAFAGLMFHLMRLARWRSGWSAFCGGGWRIGLLIVLLSGFLHLQDRHGFKVVMDEVVLLSTSKHLYETREAAMAERGYDFGSNFVILQGNPDKRPLFYPFLVSLLHDFTGYRPENTFILNALLTPLLLLLVYSVARRLAGAEAGVAAMLLLATVPLFIQTITGGGFEVLNLVMITLTLLLGMSYAKEPTADSLAAFCLSAVLLAQVRYESVLFIGPTAVVVVWTWWRHRRIELPWAVMFSPLLLVEYPWQHNLMKLQPAFWQLKDRASDHGAFSIAYFYDNVGHALNYFLSFDHTQGNSHLLLVAGAVGAGFFWLIVYREHRTIFREKPDQAVFVIFALALFAVSVLLLCYFWGAFDDIVTSRLSLPMQLLMLWLFVYAWPRLIKAPARWRTVSAICIIYLFMWTVPTARKRAYAFGNPAAESVNWVQTFIRDHHPRKSLVLDSYSLLLWIAHDIPGLTLDQLAKRPDEFLYHYRRHTFENYLIVQRMEPANYKTGEWRSIDYRDNLAKAMTLVPLDQKVFNPVYAMRISRITAVNEPEFEAWAKKRIAAQKLKASASQTGAPSAERNETENHYIEEWLRNLP
jgi:hypothetical protein